MLDQPLLFLNLRPGKHSPLYEQSAADVQLAAPPLHQGRISASTSAPYRYRKRCVAAISLKPERLKAPVLAMSTQYQVGKMPFKE